MRELSRRLGCVVFTVGLAVGLVAGVARGESPRVPGGELRIPGRGGAGVCPLEHTEVEADIAGFVARVRVRQVFRNPLSEKIEAVYVFPLPKRAAVDDMTMTVGERKTRAVMKPRGEAREIYEKARKAGQVAGLLDQERPNIFTQSVANVAPGARVVIEMSYVEKLRFEDGVYEFVFPMVVGPRYMPGRPTSRVPKAAAELKGKVHELEKTGLREGTAAPEGRGWSPDTDQVPDASRISPHVARPGFRAGHDVGLTVRIDAALPVLSLESVLHDVDVTDDGAGRKVVTLRKKREIPNRDFVLRYCVSSGEIGQAFLVHTDERGTFFTLVLQPPRRVPTYRALAKEMIFVIDRSGSMSGLPIEKAKATMRLCIEQMNPRDTFNLMSFSGGTGRCFGRPVPNTEANRAAALKYLADLHGSGGTEMMTAIGEALGGARDPERLRVVCFMTDGYIGNDFAIIDAVERNAGTARVFSFGVGNSVNRFLLGGMAHAGRGEVEYVTLKSSVDEAARRFAERIRSPVLIDIEIDWGELPVSEVYPKRYPDLFSAKPIMIHGRLDRPSGGTITLRGKTARGQHEGKIAVWPETDSGHGEALASLWARAKVASLMRQDMRALQQRKFPDELRQEVTKLGVEYRIMTQFTSFVAVEEKVVVEGGEPRTITVPVEMPEGVRHRGIFGGAARGQEDAISDIPLGGTGVVGNLGVGGGGAGCFGFRSGGGRKRAALRGGGSRRSEAAVDAALRWLARNQEPDGSWAVGKWRGTANEDNRVRLTGTVLLSFLGAGHTEKTGRHKETVRKAVAWLIRQQGAAGEIGVNRDRANGGLNHAIAGLALAEAFGMTRVPSTGAAAQKAVDCSINVFQNEYSGWGRPPRGEPDTVATAWFILQIKSATIAGLRVDGRGFQGGIAWLDKVTDMPSEATGGYGGKARPRPGRASTPQATAAAMLSRQFMGWKRSHPLLIGAANHLVGNLPDWRADAVDLCYWYYGTLAMFQMGGGSWKAWNAALRDMLIQRQIRSSDASLDGSWEPVGAKARRLGRVYSTAMCALCLEVYYRYLPLYQGTR